MVAGKSVQRLSLTLEALPPIRSEVCMYSRRAVRGEGDCSRSADVLSVRISVQVQRKGPWQTPPRPPPPPPAQRDAQGTVVRPASIAIACCNPCRKKRPAW